MTKHAYYSAMKRSLAMLITLAMILALLPVFTIGASAATATETTRWGSGATDFKIVSISFDDTVAFGRPYIQSEGGYVYDVYYYSVVGANEGTITPTFNFGGTELESTYTIDTAYTEKAGVGNTDTIGSTLTDMAAVTLPAMNNRDSVKFTLTHDSNQTKVITVKFELLAFVDIPATTNGTVKAEYTRQLGGAGGSIKDNADAYAFWSAAAIGYPSTKPESNIPGNNQGNVVKFTPQPAANYYAKTFEIQDADGTKITSANGATYNSDGTITLETEDPMKYVLAVEYAALDTGVATITTSTTSTTGTTVAATLFSGDTPANGRYTGTVKSGWDSTVKTKGSHIEINYTAVPAAAKAVLAFKVTSANAANAKLLARDSDEPNDVWDVLANKGYPAVWGTSNADEALTNGSYAGYWGPPAGRNLLGGFAGYGENSDRDFYFFATQAGTYTLTIDVLDVTNQTAVPLAETETVTITVTDSVTTGAFDTAAGDNTVTVTLTDGTFKAAPITAADFEFTGNNSAAFAAGTFTRTSDTVVTITNLALAAATNNVIIVKAAQATQATSVAAVSSSTASAAIVTAISDKINSAVSYNAKDVTITLTNKSANNFKAGADPVINSSKVTSFLGDMQIPGSENIIPGGLDLFASTAVVQIKADEAHNGRFTGLGINLKNIAKQLGINENQTVWIDQANPLLSMYNTDTDGASDFITGTNPDFTKSKKYLSADWAGDFFLLVKTAGTVTFSVYADSDGSKGSKLFGVTVAASGFTVAAADGLAALTPAVSATGTISGNTGANTYKYAVVAANNAGTKYNTWVKGVLTEAQVNTELGVTLGTAPLNSFTDNGKYLLVVGFDANGRAIAAGISGAINITGGTSAAFGVTAKSNKVSVITSASGTDVTITATATALRATDPMIDDTPAVLAEFISDMQVPGAELQIAGALDLFDASGRVQMFSATSNNGLFTGMAIDFSQIAAALDVEYEGSVWIEQTNKLLGMYNYSAADDGADDSIKPADVSTFVKLREYANMPAGNFFFLVPSATASAVVFTVYDDEEDIDASPLFTVTVNSSGMTVAGATDSNKVAALTPAVSEAGVISGVTGASSYGYALVDDDSGVADELATWARGIITEAAAESALNVAFVSTAPAPAHGEYLLVVGLDASGKVISAGISAQINLSATDTVAVKTGGEAVVKDVSTDTITVVNGKTVAELKGAVKATDDSVQTYKVTASDGTTEKTTGTLVNGDKLIVTPASGGAAKTYTIALTVAPLTVTVSTTGVISPAAPVTSGAALQYKIADTDPATAIAAWTLNTIASGESLTTPAPELTGNHGKYLIVAEVKDAKIVSAGYALINLSDTTYTVAQNGNSTTPTQTTTITLTFGSEVQLYNTGLLVRIVDAGGTGASFGSYTDTASKTTHTLPITGVTKSGNITISVTLPGYSSAPVTVPVYDGKVPVTSATITGTARVGQTLTAAANAGGTAATDTPLTYAWYRASSSTATAETATLIDGAEAATYVLQEADANMFVFVVITGTNGSSAKSAATARVSTETFSIASIEADKYAKLQEVSAAGAANKVYEIYYVLEPDEIKLNFGGNATGNIAKTKVGNGGSSNIGSVAFDTIGHATTITSGEHYTYTRGGRTINVYFYQVAMFTAAVTGDNQDKGTVRYEFEPTANPNNTKSGTLSGTNGYMHSELLDETGDGDTVTITITPANGYKVSKLSETFNNGALQTKDLLADPLASGKKGSVTYNSATDVYVYTVKTAEAANYSIEIQFASAPPNITPNDTANVKTANLGLETAAANPAVVAVTGSNVAYEMHVAAESLANLKFSFTGTEAAKTIKYRVSSNNTTWGDEKTLSASKTITGGIANGDVIIFYTDAFNYVKVKVVQKALVNVKVVGGDEDNTVKVNYDSVTGAETVTTDTKWLEVGGHLTLTITEAAKTARVTVDGKTVTNSGEGYLTNFTKAGVYNVTITFTDVVLNESNTNNISGNVYVDTTGIGDGTITLSAEKIENNTNFLIPVDSTLVIEDAENLAENTTLTVSGGGTVNVTGASALAVSSSAIEVSGSTLNVASGLDIQDGGALKVDGGGSKVEVGGTGMTLTGSSATVEVANGGSLNVSAPVDVKAGANLNVDNGGTLNLATGAALTIGETTGGTSGTVGVKNGGTLNVESGSALTVAPSSTLNLEEGSATTLAGDVTVSGNMVVKEGSTLTVNSDVKVSGNMELNSVVAGSGKLIVGSTDSQSSSPMRANLRTALFNTPASATLNIKTSGDYSTAIEIAENGKMILAEGVEMTMSSTLDNDGEILINLGSRLTCPSYNDYDGSGRVVDPSGSTVEYANGAFFVRALITINIGAQTGGTLGADSERRVTLTGLIPGDYLVYQVTENPGGLDTVVRQFGFGIEQTQMSLDVGYNGENGAVVKVWIFGSKPNLGTEAIDAASYAHETAN